MKTHLPFLALVLCICTLAFAPGAQADSDYSAMDEATFLSSLGAQATSDGPADSDGAEGGIQTNCSATAQCHNGTTRSCSSGGTCTAVDSNCNNNQRGYVNCGGTVTYCPVCPPSGPDCSIDGYCNPECSPFEDFDCECAIGASCTNNNQCGWAGFCQNNRCGCY